MLTDNFHLTFLVPTILQKVYNIRYLIYFYWNLIFLLTHLSLQSLNVRDAVRDCLEKDPSERTEEDVEILLEFTQGLKAFTNITLAVRRALCSVMVFAVVDKAGTVGDV